MDSGNYLARPSEADVQYGVDILKDALSQGDISWNEYEERLDQLVSAVTVADLRALLSQLPPRIPGPDSSCSRTIAPPGQPSGWQPHPLNPAISKTRSTIQAPIRIVMATAAVVVLAVGGLVLLRGGHPKGPSTSRVGAPASSPTPTSSPAPVPTGMCTRVPVSLKSPAGSPSKVAGQTAASVADTTLKYASEELNADALYYRLQNVTPAEGAALLATPMQALGSQATQVTTATLITPGGYDDNLTVYHFVAPAQATALVRMFWVEGCARHTHVDVFNGAVGAYLSETSPGVINFLTDLVVAVGPYAVIYRLPGQPPVSTTEPMIAQIVSSLTSSNISPAVDISDAIGPVSG